MAWNDAKIDDHDSSPTNPATKCNQAVRLMRESVERQTRVSIHGDRWLINERVTYPGEAAEGRLMNVRMVNAVFEDAKRPEFNPEANTDRFLRALPDYLDHGVRAFTINLQGGMPGYEGAINSTFDAAGNLRVEYLDRIRRVIEECDRRGAIVILGCFYQRQDQILTDDAAVRAGVTNAAQWIKGCGFRNLTLEIANEYNHPGFDHKLLKSPAGQVELIDLARKTCPGLLVSTSGLGDGHISLEIARAADFILLHFNSTKLDEIPLRIAAFKPYVKPIVCNEDDKTGAVGEKAAELCVANGASWGFMFEKRNQHAPFTFQGAADDEQVYAIFKKLTAP